MSDIELPADFVSRIEGAFGASGGRWLSELQRRVGRYRARWRLCDLRPLASPSYAWIVFADSPHGPAVLKLNVPNPEAVAEAAALDIFPAEACCRLYEDDREDGALLLESLHPGTPLRRRPSFRERVDVARDALRRLHPREDRVPHAVGSPPAGPFPRYPEQARRAFDRVGSQVSLESAGLPAAEVREMVASGRRLLAWLENNESAGEWTLLHGDLHHDNILRSGDSWRIIDPKGTLGPRALEAGRFVINQYGDAARSERRDQFTEMVRTFAGALGVSPEAVAVSAALDASVSASWSIEDRIPADLVSRSVRQARTTYEWASELAGPSSLDR